MEEKRKMQAPFLRTERSTRQIMIQVCIALIPVVLGSIYFFGMQALWMNITGMIACVVAEYGWQKLVHKKVTVSDFSAVVTGMLLACNLPVSTPLWGIVVASIFATIVGKQLFGGIGSNFANPALMGRLLLMLVWPVTLVDAISSATVLSLSKSGQTIPYSHLQMFLGDIPGAIGETSKLLILIGFAYLCFKRIVTVTISISYVITVVLLGAYLGNMNILTSLWSGSLLLGGCFMLTDYAFATKGGKVLFGITAGIFTAIVRIYGGYPEGVCFGILTANCLAGFLAGFYKPHIYGVERKRRLECKKVIGKE